MKTLSIKFYLKEGSADASGKLRLYCQLIYEREKRTFALPYKLRPEQWNAAKERTHEDESLNEELVWVEAKLMELKRKLTYEGKRFTAADLVNLFLNRKADHVRLVAYIDQFMESTAKSDRHAPGTKESYLSKLKIVKAFLEVEKKTNLPIQELDAPMLHRLDAWLTKQKSEQFKTPYKRSHINQIHKTLGTMLNQAKRQQIITSNPYQLFGPLPKDEPSEPKYLTEEELEAIVNNDLNGNESLQRVRDFFVFCCYTGLRFSDAIALEKSQIKKQTHKGQTIHTIELTQKKTGNKVVIPLFGLAATLYEKQVNSEICQLTGRLFMPLSNTKVNDYLKVIGDLCGIGKKLHHHMARHTAGTYLLSKGVPEAHVSAILGHTNTATTRRYAKILKNSLLDLVEDLKHK